MSETVKIKKENLLNAYENGTKDFKDGLVRLFPGQIIPIGIHERIKNRETISFEDILADQKITPEAFEATIYNHSEYTAAFERAVLISKAFNITPLKDGEYWYVLYLNKSGSEFSSATFDYWRANTNVGARLIGFRNRADAEWVGNNLAHIYKPLA